MVSYLQRDGKKQVLFTGVLVVGSVFFGLIKARRVPPSPKHLSAKVTANILPAPVETPGNKNYPIATAALGLTVAGHLVFAPLTLLGVGCLSYLLVPTWKQAYHDITKRKRFTIIVLEAIFLPSALLAGKYVAVAIAFWFLYFALDNVAKAKGNTTKNLANIFVEPSSQAVYMLREGVEIELQLKDVRIGDILVIGSGEIIPVDGIITQGHANIDQHMLTGESQPVEKQPGDPVLAATMLLTGRIHIRVEKTGVETIANQTSQVLNDMTSYTDQLELRGTASANRMALPVFMAGSTISLFKGLTTGMAMFWTPYDDALYTAGPLSVLNFLNIALQRGILIKDGSALETMRSVDTIVFDKTGTLTNDTPQVVKVHTCGALSEADVLYYAAAAEQKQLHPVALAILEAAAAKAIELPAVENMAYKTGYGLTAMLDEKVIKVGSYRFMQQSAFPIPDTLQLTEAESHEYGYSLIYLAVDEQVVGAIELHASLRADAAASIARLHTHGYRVCIISGDHEKPTRHLAGQLGIKHYFAETLPQDKANLIKSMQDEGRTVCYMGDGINDTIALKQANVSVSLRGASTIATDTAQIVLMNEELSQLLDLIELSKRLDHTHKKIVFSSAVPSAGIFGGLVFFHITLSTAVIGYVAGLGASITHAMLPLLKERRLKHKKSGRF